MGKNDNKIKKEIITQGERYVQKEGWKVLATSRNNKGKETIRKILEEFDLKNILYHPNLLIEKEDYKFFVIFSEKAKHVKSNTKKYGKRLMTGIDWYKYQLALYVEATTGIQVGLMIYSNESKELVIKQMNQLGKPISWFKGDGCLLQAISSTLFKPNEKKDIRLGKVFQDPLMTQKEKDIIEQIKTGEINPPILQCIQCYNLLYPICHRCIKGKHKSIKALAVWEINEFQKQKLTIQPQLEFK